MAHGLASPSGLPAGLRSCPHRTWSPKNAAPKRPVRARRALDKSTPRGGKSRSIRPSPARRGNFGGAQQDVKQRAKNKKTRKKAVLGSIQDAGSCSAWKASDPRESMPRAHLYAGPGFLHKARRSASWALATRFQGAATRRAEPASACGGLRQGHAEKRLGVIPT